MVDNLFEELIGSFVSKTIMVSPGVAQDSHLGPNVSYWKIGKIYISKYIKRLHYHIAHLLKERHNSKNPFRDKWI